MSKDFHVDAIPVPMSPRCCQLLPLVLLRQVFASQNGLNYAALEKAAETSSLNLSELMTADTICCSWRTFASTRSLFGSSWRMSCTKWVPQFGSATETDPVKIRERSRRGLGSSADFELRRACNLDNWVQWVPEVRPADWDISLGQRIGQQCGGASWRHFVAIRCRKDHFDMC